MAQGEESVMKVYLDEKKVPSREGYIIEVVDGTQYGYKGRPAAERNAATVDGFVVRTERGFWLPLQYVPRPKGDT